MLSVTTPSIRYIPEVVVIGSSFGKCRCCLAVGLHPRPFGKADMESIKKNLNLFIEVDPRLPHLICKSCISSLQVIKSFRTMVMKSESVLHNEFYKGVKIETQTTGEIDENSEKDPLEVPSEVKSESSDDNGDSDMIEDSTIKTTIELSQNDLDKQIQGKVTCAKPLGNKTIPSTPQINNIPDILKNESFTTVTNKSQEKKSSLGQIMPSGLTILPIDPGLLKKNMTIKIVRVNSETMNKDLKLLPLGPQIKNEMDDKPQTVKRLRSVETLTGNSSPSNTSKQTGRLEKHNVKRRKPESAFFTRILFGDKQEIATDNTKLRSNIIQTLRYTTIVPFRFTQSFMFKCFYCDQTAAKFSQIKQHTNTEHQKRPSDHAILKTLQTRNHKLIHGDITYLNCKLCDEKHDNVQDIVKHLSDVHEIVYYDIKNSQIKCAHGIVEFRLENDSFNCHLCSKEFRFFKSLSHHMSEHYDCFHCKDCGKMYLTPSKLNAHWKRHHKLKETKCPECDKLFKSQSTMQAHRYVMHIRKPSNVIKCTLCPETFLVSRSTARYIHMEKVHGVKRPAYCCKMCNKDFNSVHAMNSHRRTYHERKNPFMCDVCGYVTMDRSTMERHLDYHNGVKKIECDICHKKLRTRSTLRVHLRGHFNDKRFACSLCDAAFIQKHCLKSHVKSRHPDSSLDNL